MKTIYFISGFSAVVCVICLWAFLPSKKKMETVLMEIDTTKVVQVPAFSSDTIVGSAMVTGYDTTLFSTKKGADKKAKEVDSTSSKSIATIAANSITGGVVSSSAYKVYTFSGAANEAELFAMLRSHRLSPAYSKSLTEKALLVLKNKNFGAGTIAISAGALVYTAEQGLDIDLKYKILIAIAFSLLVFLLVKFLQGKDILE